MSNFLNLDPKILSALIAAITSLTIAGISGFYVMVATRKKLVNLKKETITEALAELSVESFNTDRREYREAYRLFTQRALSVSGDMGALLKEFVEFYRETARLFALRNKDFIGSAIIEKIPSTDDALARFFQAKRDDKADLTNLADKAYREMKTVIEGLAEQ